MICFRQISHTLTAWLLFGVICALPVSDAQATCAQWAIKDPFAIHQKNDFWVTFYAKQIGTDFHGLAESSDEVTGLLDGHIDGDKFTATVTWAGGSIGVYNGTVFENGYLGGITHDETHPESSTSWRSLYNLDCLTTAGTAMGGAHLDPRLFQLQTAQMEFCRKYAAAAVADSREWQGLSCGAAGPLWSIHANDHLSWCLGLNGDQGQPKAKTAAREDALQPCRERFAQQKQLEPQAPIGDTLKPADPLDKAGVFMKPGTGIEHILKETEP